MLPSSDTARARSRERGQGLAEYAVILALVALFVLAGLLLLSLHFGDQVSLATPVPSGVPSAVPGPSFVGASPIG
jgi:Flp pilus assembly pilin Flp